MYNIVIWYFYPLQSDHHSKSGLSSVTIQSYYNIIDSIPYAVHYIFVTYFTAESLYLLILFTISPTPLPLSPLR